MKRDSTAPYVRETEPETSKLKRVMVPIDMALKVPSEKLLAAVRTRRLCCPVTIAVPIAVPVTVAIAVATVTVSVMTHMLKLLQKYQIKTLNAA